MIFGLWSQASNNLFSVIAWANSHHLGRGVIIQTTSILRNPFVTITVSRLFSDKHVGAVTEDTESSGEPQPKRPRSLLQRLHIRTSHRREKASNSIVKPSVTKTVGISSSPKVSEQNLTSRSNAADIEEITKIMPQSLIIGSSQGIPTKRQRSTDGRANGGQEATVEHDDAGRSSLVPNTTPSKPSVQMPPYLEKTRSGKSFIIGISCRLTCCRDFSNFSGSRVEAAFSIVPCNAESRYLTIQGRQISGRDQSKQVW